MNLRMQFIVLVLGVILVPFLTMGISFTVFDKIMYPSNPRLIAEDFFSRVEKADSADQIEELFTTLEDSYFAIMIPPSESVSSNGVLEDINLNSTMIVASRLYKFNDGSESYIILGVQLITDTSIIFPIIFSALKYGSFNSFTSADYPVY